jgi:hypothetical protein
MTAAHLAAPNVQFGRTTDRHADDRIAAPIGGSRVSVVTSDHHAARPVFPSVSVLIADSALAGAQWRNSVT